MKAYVFSIGEPTTELCVWSLERLGFEVVLWQDNSRLWDKLRRLYFEAEADFVRADADCVFNKNVLKLEPTDACVWHKGKVWDWYRQDLSYCGIHWIKQEAIHVLRANIDKFEKAERPETMMNRLAEFHNPRIANSCNLICGLHGYKQGDIQRVKDTKLRRNQDYDWELYERINAL